MQHRTLTLNYLELDSPSDLPAQDLELLHAARNAAIDAYAPYSGFRVGAAVLLDDGTVVKGNNQENAAFPSGLCAERVALFAAAAQFPAAKVIAIAITAISREGEIDEPIPPCGACRQVMQETETRTGQSVRVIMAGNAGKVIILDSAADLLPFVFTFKIPGNET